VLPGARQLEALAIKLCEEGILRVYWRTRHLEEEDMVEAVAAVAELEDVEYLLRHTRREETYLGILLGSEAIAWGCATIPENKFHIKRSLQHKIRVPLGPLYKCMKNTYLATGSHFVAHGFHFLLLVQAPRGCESLLKSLFGCEFSGYATDTSVKINVKRNSLSNE
jgi:hypothetical protein